MNGRMSTSLEETKIPEQAHMEIVCQMTMLAPGMMLKVELITREEHLQFDTKMFFDLMQHMKMIGNMLKQEITHSINMLILKKI